MEYLYAAAFLVGLIGLAFIGFVIAEMFWK